MPPLTSFAVAAAVVLVGFAISAGTGPIRRWWVPALLSAAFLGYSLWPIATLGPLGFWPEHVDDPWSLQIWFDLLCALGVGWALLAPRARAAGVTPWPWLGLILVSGSIGLLAMLAFVLRREAVLREG